MSNEAAPEFQYSWAIGPFPLISTPQFQTGATDQFTKVASSMALVHNSIIRGFNSIYLQSRRVQPCEYKNFIGYSLAWCELVNVHHHGEEHFLFPSIEAREETGLMEANVRQHEVFHKGLETFADYLRTLKGQESQFSSMTLLSRIDVFKDVLTEHLNEEITTILNLAKYGDKVDLLTLMSKEGEKTMGSLSKFAALPLFFANHDVTFENGMHAAFPPAPWIAKMIMMHVFTWWNAEFWKFAMCNTWGTPKELHYA